MIGESAHDEDDGYRRARSETGVEQLDRNWLSLLQELRVVQTGVQLLTGFLLILPFQARFADLGTSMRVVYLVTVSSSVGASILLTAPVGMHRLLFRRHRLTVLVTASHMFALVGMSLLGATMTGVAILVFDAVSGPTLGWIAGAVAALFLISFWVLLPLALRRGPKDPYD